VIGLQYGIPNPSHCLPLSSSIPDSHLCLAGKPLEAKMKRLLWVMIPLLAIGITGCDSSSGSATSSNSTTITYGTLTDSRDGQTYKTVKIGTQTWMAQNLNYKVDSSWCYDDSASNCTKYGRLYQWAAAMGLEASYNQNLWRGNDSAKQQGICPSGWHVPTDTEWGTLITYVGADSARIKLSSTSGWDTTYSKGTDTYGFTVLPAGLAYGGSFSSLYAYFWSSSEYGASKTWHRDFCFGSADTYRSFSNKIYGFSLRCLQN